MEQTKLNNKSDKFCDSARPKKWNKKKTHRLMKRQINVLKEDKKFWSSSCIWK